MVACPQCVCLLRGGSDDAEGEKETPIGQKDQVATKQITGYNRQRLYQCTVSPQHGIRSHVTASENETQQCHTDADEPSRIRDHVVEACEAVDGFERREALWIVEVEWQC